MFEEEEEYKSIFDLNVALPIKRIEDDRSLFETSSGLFGVKERPPELFCGGSIVMTREVPEAIRDKIVSMLGVVIDPESKKRMRG